MTSWQQPPQEGYSVLLDGGNVMGDFRVEDIRFYGRSIKRDLSMAFASQFGDPGSSTYNGVTTHWFHFDLKPSKEEALKLAAEVIEWHRDNFWTLEATECA